VVCGPPRRARPTFATVLTLGAHRHPHRRVHGHPADLEAGHLDRVQIDRFRRGKIVESWVDWDKYRFLEGLGALK